MLSQCTTDNFVVLQRDFVSGWDVFKLLMLIVLITNNIILSGDIIILREGIKKTLFPKLWVGGVKSPKLLSEQKNNVMFIWHIRPF